MLHLDEECGLILVEERRADCRHGLPLRAIIAAALELGSRGLIVAHNHPDGDPRPSDADLEATRRLAETAGTLGIRLHDHLIFAGGQCRSFRQLGLL